MCFYNACQFGDRLIIEIRDAMNDGEKLLAGSAYLNGRIVVFLEFDEDFVAVVILPLQMREAF